MTEYGKEHRWDARVCGIGLRPGKDVERASAELGYWLGVTHWARGHHVLDVFDVRGRRVMRPTREVTASGRCEVE
jgi:hypothetical protein